MLRHGKKKTNLLLNQNGNYTKKKIILSGLKMLLKNFYLNIQTAIDAYQP